MPPTDRKKILIALYYYHPYVSGLSLLAKSLAEGLVARGHQVTVLTTRYDSRLPTQEVFNGVDVIRAKILVRAGKGVVSFDFLRKIVALSRSHDIVNPHLPMAHFGLVIPFIKNSRIITQYHCDLNLGSGLLSKFIEKISYWSMARTLQKSDQIIVTTKDYFCHCHFSRYLDKAVGIYPPIDQTKFVVKSCDDLKSKLQVDPDSYLIGFVGRIVKEKGLEYLLEAIPFLEKDLDEFQILIAGDYENVAGGSIKQSLDRIASLYKHRVKFLGPLDFTDLVSFYNLIDVLVLPSVDPLEAFGMVQVEALLCQTPVVVSDMPGVREVVNKTGFGMVAKMKNPQDIAAKIVELKNNPVQIRLDSLSEFNYSRCIDRYEKVFLES